MPVGILDDEIIPLVSTINCENNIAKLQESGNNGSLGNIADAIGIALAFSK
jgi:hypothetical protein